MDQFFKKIIKYYYKCVKAESTLGKYFDINPGNGQCLINKLSEDISIYNKDKNQAIFELDGNSTAFFQEAKIVHNDIFYGYPLYIKQFRGRVCALPIFSIKLTTLINGRNVEISKNDVVIRCNIKAFDEFGCDDIESLQEEIDAAENRIESLQEWISFLDNILRRFKDKAHFKDNLECNNMLNSKYVGPGIYNKNIIFPGKPTDADVFLLEELKALYNRENYTNTSLILFSDDYVNQEIGPIENRVLIFPYDSDEYKKEATFLALQNNHTIVTGPPGTGKSQFICNLIANLYKSNNTVLFVSHTNDAVDIVNNKLGRDFPGIIIRTGNQNILEQIPVQGWGENLQEVNNDLPNLQNELRQTWELLLNLNKDLIRSWSKKNAGDNIIDNILKNISNIWGFLFSRLWFVIYKHFFKNFNNKILNLENEIINYNKTLTRDSREWLAHYHINRFNQSLIGHNPQQALIGLRHGHNINQEEFLLCQNNIKIWSCTLRSLKRSFPLEPNLFDYVIFDEASQIDIASAIPAMYRAQNAIIIGDDNQLQPIIQLPRGVEAGIRANTFRKQPLEIQKNQSILDYIESSIFKYGNSKINTSRIKLNKHYRSHDDIVSMYNEIFYDKTLKVLTTNTDQNRHVFWINCDKSITETNEAGSKFNRQEATTVIKLLNQILNNNQDNNTTIGIVTPYRAQADLISRQIRNINQAQIDNHQIECLSAHKFQGSEKDIIIYSNVVSSGVTDSWYQRNGNILNVALSRARNDLYIVGNKLYCEQLPANHYLKKVVSQCNYLDSRCGGCISNNEVDYLYDRLYNNLTKSNIKNFGYNIERDIWTRRYGLKIVISNNHNKYALLINFKDIEQNILHNSAEPIILNNYKRRYLQDGGYQIIDIDPTEILFFSKVLIKKIKRLIFSEIDIDEETPKILIKEMIEQGEDKTTEYKSSLRWDFEKACVNTALEGVVAQTIASFLNSDGGNLLIGVKDDGGIVGIEKDYSTFGRNKGRDDFRLKLDQIISNQLGDAVQVHLTHKIVSFQGKDICIVKVRPSKHPVYFGLNRDFIIRRLASKKILNTEEAMIYIKEHVCFKKNRI